MTIAFDVLFQFSYNWRFFTNNLSFIQIPFDKLAFISFIWHILLLFNSSSFLGGGLQLYKKKYINEKIHTLSLVLSSLLTVRRKYRQTNRKTNDVVCMTIKCYVERISKLFFPNITKSVCIPKTTDTRRMCEMERCTCVTFLLYDLVETEWMTFDSLSVTFGM